MAVEQCPQSYCLFVRFREGRVQAIRDYRYAQHVFAEAPWSVEGDLARRLE